MGKKTLPQIVQDIFVLLDPLESEDRQKVVDSVMALLGDAMPRPGRNDGEGKKDSGDAGDDATYGQRAKRWMDQNNISAVMISEIFHIDGDEVEVIASEVPGNGKKMQTHNCYLLAGIQALLSSDEPRFSDECAIELCKHLGCHDRKNHAKNRSELGNVVAGTKNNGFTLPAPGLRAAANLVKEMSQTH
ncbi:hypothetical protein [Gimesia chilikensis]|uniref:Uncharacterized protein n=1 Tax=Gimesia chilikensis TaxID=2605989 RepID=A0A517PWW1_9PLAN|nr:hypothetical protein [Gimesia chilikensis]QDT23877.1 hypothetical protein HG66A1_57020 [Gimesia chilikensis]